LQATDLRQQHRAPKSNTKSLITTAGSLVRLNLISAAGQNEMTHEKLTLTLLFASALATVAQAAPKATDYPAPKPAFAGQTRAPAPKAASNVHVEVLVEGALNNPWSLAFLPDGKLLVTEVFGAMRTIDKHGVVSAPIADVPGVKAIGGLGLQDVALDPDFVHNRTLYFTYFAPPPGEDPAIWPNEKSGSSLNERRRKPFGIERVARARLSEDDKRLEDVRTLLEGVERRIVVAADGTLYIAGSDRYRLYDSTGGGPNHEINDPDVLRNLTGRVAHINTDGSMPADNPFLGEATVSPDTWSYGHRDPESLATNPTTGELWIAEHGPMGGDEVNIVRAGRDYGWPNVSYGRQYTGAPVARTAAAKEGLTAKAGTEQPIYYWYPDVAPSGLMFYTGELFPAWKGNAFLGALGEECLIRLVLDGNRIVAEEHLLLERKQRVRDVRQGPDGAVYLLTDDGMLLRLTPGK
jgi:aldose sugar dehydrogenase